MHRRWQTVLSIILYVMILAYALDFDIFQLLDVQLIFLILLGTIMLTLPFVKRDVAWQELTYIFGRKAIEAGFIQTFLLIFARLQNIKSYENILGDIALCFRPLLYGFCLLILLSERAESKPSDEKKCDKQEIPTAHDFLALSGLTKRETEIAQLILQGKSNAEIGKELFISETTVKKHVSNIFEKTDVSRREELIIKAQNNKGTE